MKKTKRLSTVLAVVASIALISFVVAAPYDVTNGGCGQPPSF